MLKKITYGKVLVVILLTVLIWVWADLALDEPLPDKLATIVVDESANPKLLVRINQASSADIRIMLSGPHVAIVDLDRKLKEGKEKLEFGFDVAQEKMDEPGDYTLILLPFLQKVKEIKQLGLKVVSCEQDALAVNVVELVEKPLVVKCVGEDQNPVKPASIEPAQVDMFVPDYWEGEKLTAEVRLTQREIEQARLSAIEKIPYIVLAAGQTRNVPTIVKITMPPEEEALRNYTITVPTMGFTLSANLLGKYRVDVKNLDAVMSAISIVATADAKRAYEEMRYQVKLEIYDSDKDEKSTEPLRRELIYNFPAEYVREGEIELKQQPVIARFKLIPLLSTETVPSVGE